MESGDQDDEGVKSTKRQLLASTASRFRDVEHLKYFVLATVLDPRYKLRCFSSPSKATAAREMLLEEYQSCTS